MVTRSIVGRFLILAVLIVAVGVVAQAALILTEGGKKAVKTASAAPVSTPATADPGDAPAGDPVRVVYPGPLGETVAQKPKLADAAPASPLSAPAPQTTAKLVQAMTDAAPAVDKAAPPPAPHAAAQAPQPLAATPVVASTDPDPAPVDTASAPEAAPPAMAPRTTPVSTGVEVASLGGGAPAAEASSAGGVNINTASVAELNRLGGGRIGQSIASHRPYKSVEDLVKKRILRRTVYDQIKNQIAAK